MYSIETLSKDIMAEMLIFILPLLLLLIVNNSLAERSKYKLPDSGNNYQNRNGEVLIEDEYSLPVPEMIRSYGYTCEVHNYTTEDGYINTLHRIPPTSKTSDKEGHIKVVFLQHGLLGTSADYVMGRPDKSLGYMLADRGYDVWLGNARGNAYSRAHTNMTLDSDEYWRFSFDQMGRYDLPAAFEYIKAMTKVVKLYYVGHSMGTTMFWIASHEHSEYIMRTVEFMVALGPVSTVSHMVSPIRHLAYLVDDIEDMFDALGIHEFSPANWVTELFARIACDPTMEQLKLCQSLIFLLVGFDYKQANLTLLPIILGHDPGGTSTQTIIHFAQEYNSGYFRKFDYGRDENLIEYNSTVPPEYDISKVQVPVVLMYADNDWLADPKDVENLFSLPHLIESYKVPYMEFNHLDFLWALNAPELIYQKIFKLFNHH